MSYGLVDLTVKQLALLIFINIAVSHPLADLFVLLHLLQHQITLRQTKIAFSGSTRKIRLKLHEFKATRLCLIFLEIRGTYLDTH